MYSQLAMVGTSAGIRNVREEIEYAARFDAKILITGESGVGKEIVARSIHQQSARRNAPLVTINCAGIPDTLLESELFGHVKGSFTDASRDKRGWLEQAHQGTIFMDEVGEMSLRMQGALLRFLETGEIHRVGSDRALPPLNVRVIAATNRKLLDAVADKSFREDLYYRLNVIHIEVPPLRERREDVLPLLMYFLGRHHAPNTMQVSAQAEGLLTGYEWPGNVRELKNVAERLALRVRGHVINASDLPAELAGRTVRPTVSRAPVASSTAEALLDCMLTQGQSFWSVVYEPFVARDLTRRDLRELIQRGLEHTRGNYKLLVTTFNMAADDYKRFLNFLRKHQCHVPFQQFRQVPGRIARDTHESIAITA